VVLGPAHRLDALSRRCAARIDVVGDVGGADEAHGLDVRVVEDGVHRDLVAMDDVQHTLGRASLHHQLAQAGTDGSFSEGFRMKLLPTAIAMPNIHIGIIAGKLNGVIPATTPSGWRME